MKIEINLIVKPKTQKEYLRIKTVLLNKNYKLNTISTVCAHYVREKDLISLAKV